MPSRESAPPVHMGASRHLESGSGPLTVTWARFGPGALLDRHCHDRPTFGLMLEGGFDLEFPNPAIRRRSLECGAGIIFSEPAGEPHVNRVFDGGASVLVIQPDPAAETAAPFTALLDRVNHFRNGRLHLLARRLAREVAEPDALSGLASEAFALEILVGAARLDPRERAPGPAPGWFRRVEELVHERFREKLTIAELAAEAGVHPAHLSAEFRRRHDVSLGRYVRRLRLEWVAEQLRGSPVPISRVALRAGFSDQAHLTRAFKRYTGTTPGRYRRGAS